LIKLLIAKAAKEVKNIIKIKIICKNTSALNSANG